MGATWTSRNADSGGGEPRVGAGVVVQGEVTVSVTGLGLVVTAQTVVHSANSSLVCVPRNCVQPESWKRCS